MAFSGEVLGSSIGTEVPLSPDDRFSDSNDHYFANEWEPHLPLPVLSLALLSANTLFDQGFVISIFLPPKSIIIDLLSTHEHPVS